MSAERLPEPETNFLTDLAGIEFECSIAAAELNAKVHELTEKEELKHGYHIVGYRGGESVSATVTRTQYTHSYGGEKLDVVIARPELQPETVAVEKVHRRWRSRRPTVTAPKSVPAFDDPLLGIRFGNVILPIATFAQRLDDDTCSYVQLGSEINGDAFFATKLDETTKRGAIVESLRDVKKFYGVYEDEYQSSLPGPAQKLVAAELERNELELKHQLAGQLSRTAFARLQKHLLSTQAQFTELTAAGMTPRSVSHQPLSLAYPLPNGVKGYLTLAGDQQNANSAHIGFVVRGSVFLPLIRFERGGLPVPCQVPDLGVSTLRKLTAILNGRPVQITDQKLTITYDKAKGESPSPAQRYLQSMGLVIYRNKQTGWADGDTRTADGSDFVDYLNGFKNLTDKKGDLIKLTALFKLIGPMYQKLFTQLGAPAAAAEAIPVPTSRENDKLLTMLGHIAGFGSLEGELTRMKIGKTTGNLVVRASLRPEDRYVHLTLDGRPSAMPQQRYRTLFLESFDLLGSVSLPHDRVKDLLRVIADLKRP